MKPLTVVRRTVLALSCLSALTAATGAAAAIAAQSDFSLNTEGWLLAGDAITDFPSHIATGGNPDGFSRGTDQTIGGVWYWQAPAKFLGDRSLSFGQMLSFDLRMRGSGPLFESPDLKLIGGGLTLNLDLAPVPQDLVWTTYAVTLDQTTAWHVGSAAGPAATEAQVRQVLADLQTLQIRGEFITGADNGDLDNVILSAVPEPQTYALFGAGLALIGCSLGRHRKPSAAHR